MYCEFCYIRKPRYIHNLQLRRRLLVVLIGFLYLFCLEFYDYCLKRCKSDYCLLGFPNRFLSSIPTWKTRNAWDILRVGKTQDNGLIYVVATKVSLRWALIKNLIVQDVPKKHSVRIVFKGLNPDRDPVGHRSRTSNGENQVSFPSPPPWLYCVWSFNSKDGGFCCKIENEMKCVLCIKE